MKYYEKIAFASIGVIRFISVITAPFVKFLTFSTNIVSKIFGVSGNEEEIVTEEQIRKMDKKEYRRLCIQTHPDRNPNDSMAQQIFVILNKIFQG